MFKRPFKVKSNVILRSTERKKLFGRIDELFKLKEEDDAELFPTNRPVSWIKILTHSGDLVNLYSCQGLVLFFEIEGRFYPTVSLLWRCPYLIPYIKVGPCVQWRLLKGADLMIPGIAQDQSALTENDYPEGTVVYINTVKNKAAFAVGVTLVKTSEMCIPEKKGKAVVIIHVHDDEVSKMNTSDSVIPMIPFITNPSVDDAVTTDLVQALQQVTSSGESSVESDCLYSNSSEQLSPIIECPESPELALTQDDILLYSFTKALKNLAPNLVLPILTNIFYKNFVVESVPVNMSLEVKKTKYKKLSVFLTEMAKDGVISVETVKGVQSITSVNYNHEIFKSFVDTYKGEDTSKKEELKKPVIIVEKKVINGAVDKIFNKYGYSKGDSISDQEIRKVITKYVNEENLSDPNTRIYINLNGVLCDVLQSKNSRITWKDLFDSISKKMGDSFEITLPNNQIITRKGKLTPIEMTLANKASNKKVTLVNNLELYGINIQEFSKECQHGVAASVTINSLPNKSTQLQIQGNQKKFIGNLLLEKYLIPKKFIQGLEEQKSKKN